MKNMNSQNIRRANYIDVPGSLQSLQSLQKPTRLRDFGAFQITDQPVEQVSGSGSGSTLSVMEAGREQAGRSEPFTPTPEAEVIASLPMLIPHTSTALTEASAWRSSSLMDGGTMPVVIPFPYEPASEQEEDWQLERVVQRKALFLTLRMLCTIALSVLVLRAVSWPVLFEAVSHISLEYAGAGLLVGVVGILAGCYQWRGVLQGVRMKADLGQLMRFYLIGLAFSYVLPFCKDGERAKAFYLGRASGNPRSSANAVRISRVTGMIGMMLLGMPVPLFWPHFAPWILLSFFGLAALMGLYLAGVVSFSSKLLEWQYRWPRFQRLTSLLRLGTVLRQAIRREAFPRAILVGIVCWFFTCLNFYCYAHALHLQIPLPFYCVAIPLISLVTMVPISMNGFGLRELLFVSIFSTLHIPVALSLLLVLLMDVQLMLFGGIGSCLYFARAK